MKISLHFGALAKAVRRQLDEQGVDYEAVDCTHWQKDADAVTRLAVRGLLTEVQAHSARKKLMRKIVKAVGQP